MSQIVIQTCGGKYAFERYLETIASPIDVSTLSNDFPDSDYSALQNVFPDGSARIWGIGLGRKNIDFDKWRRIEPGAFVLFSGRVGHELGRSDVFSGGTVKFKARNRNASLQLWGLSDSGDAWECLLFFDEIRVLSFTYDQVNAVLGYKPGNVFRGLTVLDNSQSNKLTNALQLDRLNSQLESSREELLATKRSYPREVAHTIQPLRDDYAMIESQAGSPAYFSSMTVENVRCFGPAQTLSFTDVTGSPKQWTIIVGDNGVGKTTLLQCLAALLPIESSALSARAKARRAAARLITDEPLKSDWKPYRDGVGSNFFQLRGTYSIGAELTVQGGGRTKELYAIWTKKGYQFNTVKSKELEVFCVAYGASRRLGESSLSEKTGIDATASLFRDTVDLIDAEEWLLQADYASKSSEDSALFRDQIQKIKSILQEILPQLEEIRIGQVSELHEKPTVEFKTPYGWVSLRDLSLGYKTSVAWMVDLASRLYERYSGSPNPLQEPAIVLIDELDLHLHPRMQRDVISRLTHIFPHTQFIATVHSPLIVQSAVDSNLVLLKRQDNYVVVDDDITAVRNWRIDQVLTSELFEIPSPRPRWMDGLLAERQRILSQPQLTEQDHQRIKEIEKQIGTMPTEFGERDLDAMEVIRRAAEYYKSQGI